MNQNKSVENSASQSNLFQPLPEKLRLSYLKAMGVISWIPRDAEGQTSETVALTIENQNRNKNPVNPVKQEVPAPDINIPVTSENNQSQQSFLKKVNWKQNQNADKHLLIICRHETSQPAQSFANPNAPSMLMQDIIKSLESCLPELSVQISLAHLTQAGLTEASQPVERSLNESKPDLILMLGDATIKLLLGAEEDVNSMRQKLSQFQNCKTLVSYHPYTLVQSPILKKMVMEDIQLLARLLSE